MPNCSSGYRKTISCDRSLSYEDAHAEGAMKLRDALGWTGEMIDGHTGRPI